jgi:hypothetical protein
MLTFLSVELDFTSQAERLVRLLHTAAGHVP